MLRLRFCSVCCCSTRPVACTRRILRSCVIASSRRFQTPDAVFVCAANGQALARRCPVTGAATRRRFHAISPQLRSQMFRQPGDLRRLTMFYRLTQRGGVASTLPDIPATEYCGYGRCRSKRALNTSRMLRQRRCSVGVASPASLPASVTA